MMSPTYLVLLSGLLFSGIVTGSEVRLAGNSTYKSGRVEIRKSSSDPWSTVSGAYWTDDSYGKANADVVCRMLGFLSAERAVLSAGFGPGTGTIYPNHIHCGGRESDLLRCASSRLGGSDHQLDVGVVCKGIEIENVRLVGGTHRLGRLEVRRNNTEAWRTICNSHWEKAKADVVCRMIGFRFSNKIRSAGLAISLGFGKGSGHMYWKSFKCNGLEPDLKSCSYRGLDTGSQSCTHNEDIGVECAGIEVRLTNGTDRSGRVEIRRSDKEAWGTVCNDFWAPLYNGKQNADVVCRMLGFPSAERSVMTSQFGQGVGPIYLDDVRCNGTESDLMDCPSTFGADVVMHSCDHSEDVGVVCQEKTTSQPLTNLTQQTTATIEAGTTTNQPLSNRTQQTTVQDTKQEPLTCPENLVAVTSPGTDQATFQLKLGDQVHTLMLPLGQHPYTIKSLDKTCNLTLIAADYRVRNTMEFVADYSADCGAVNSTVAWKLLENVADQKYSIIEDLCDSVCKKPGQGALPVLSCNGKNDLQIRWPTDLVFTADSVSVPANITRTLENRIRNKGLTLDVVVFGASPPIVYPRKTANGGYVSIALSKTCINGLTYSDVEKKCV